ncbi:MAG: glycoside hydrolase family 11 protein, partial [Oscillospiraceae bacterium]|nr:glycoside hydrolase family 11 protein [Oscillospiraceae bacterium]
MAVWTAGCSSPQGQPPSDQTTVVSSETPLSDQVFTENKIGTYDGYGYELWKDKGTTKFTVSKGGTFSCEWSDINNALFRRGQKYDCTKKYTELGDISLDFGADYEPDGNSYFCVYGWTRSPLVEFYIVESWGTWRPPGAPMALGTVEVDGAVYDIYKTIRVNQPSIDGTKTFDQYWSVRKEKPTAADNKIEGTISVSKHFDAWAECGLELGNMYEVALTVEGYQSAGKADIYKNDLKIDGEYKKAEDTKVTVNAALASKPKIEIPEGGAELLDCDFEDGTQGWMPRGGVQIDLSKDFAVSGDSSLVVSGRGENWNGAAIMLSPDTYKQGGTYGFSVNAMQNSGSPAKLKLTMQYTADDGEHYDQVSLKIAKSGEWMELKNDSFTIPMGAENLILYVESPDSLTDIYIDDVKSTYVGGGAETEPLKKKEDTVYEAQPPVAVPNNADISWIDPEKPMVAIAFDDGASAVKKTDPAYRIIDAMSDNGFHATFFYVSDWIKTEAQVKYAYDKGMEIANHTKTHPYLSKKEPAEIRAEFDKAHERLKGIIGAEPSKVMRIPFLDYNKKVTDTLNDVALITCSVDTMDWNNATKDEI